MKKEYYFSTSSFSLYTTCYIPPQKPKAVILIIHGISEHFGRYNHFATHLCKNGFIVIGCDLPGHGKTVTHEDDFGFFAETNGWHLVSEALYELISEHKNEYSSLPFFLFGHSMGSFLVRTLMIDHQDIADAIILSGTAHYPERILKSGQSFTALTQRISTPKEKNKYLENFLMGHHYPIAYAAIDWITHNKEYLDDYLDDPLCGHPPTVSLLKDLVEGLHYIQSPQNIVKINKTTPIYFFSGDEDPVGEYGKGVERAIEAYIKAGSQNIDYMIYKNGRHEMIHELNQSNVYKDIIRWMKKQIKLISKSKNPFAH